MGKSTLTLPGLSAQARARRERHYDSGLEIEYPENNGHPGGVLVFPVPGQQTFDAGTWWRQSDPVNTLIELVGKSEARLFFHTKPSQEVIDELMIVLGIEYEWADERGLQRLELSYQKWRDATDRQREMLGAPQSKARPKKKVKPKK